METPIVRTSPGRQKGTFAARAIQKVEDWLHKLCSHFVGEKDAAFGGGEATVAPLHQFGVEQLGNLFVPPVPNEFSRYARVHPHPEGGAFGSAEYGCERFFKT